MSSSLLAYLPWTPEWGARTAISHMRYSSYFFGRPQDFKKWLGCLELNTQDNSTNLLNSISPGLGFTDVAAKAYHGTQLAKMR